MCRCLRISLKYVIVALVAAVFVYFALRGTDYALLVQSLRGANYWWMLVVILLLMVSHLFRAWRWRFLLEPVKEDIRLKDLFS